MYYKITDKDSDIYKKLRSLRENELRMDEENLVAIKERIPYKWTRRRGYNQQSFYRTKTYAAFTFEDSENVDTKIWTKNPKDPVSDFFWPNKKTKLGRAMDNFLNKGLQRSHFLDVLDMLDVKLIDVRQYPFLELIEDTLLLWLDDEIRISDINIIEITSSEFHSYIEIANNRLKN